MGIFTGAGYLREITVNNLGKIWPIENYSLNCTVNSLGKIWQIEKHWINLLQSLTEP